MHKAAEGLLAGKRLKLLRIESCLFPRFVGLGASKGEFGTTSTFSAPARDLVEYLSQRIILVDGLSLADLVTEHGVGVRTNRVIEFKRVDEDFFSEDN